MNQRPRDDQQADAPNWAGTGTATYSDRDRDSDRDTSPASAPPQSTADLLGRGPGSGNGRDHERAPQMDGGPTEMELPADADATDPRAARADGADGTTETAEMTSPQTAAPAAATARTPGPRPDTSASTAAATTAPLLSETEAETYRTRWHDIQSRFVDDPRQAVEQGDQLVAEVIQHLAEVFAQERNTLEEQWSGGGEAQTEDLRVALQRYRSFFDRLLSA